MPTTAIISLSSSDQQHGQGISLVKEKLLAKFPTVTPSSWGMNIRLLKSTSNAQSQDTQYVLRASHFDDDTFLAIENAHRLSVMAIKSEDTEPFVKMLQEKFNTLWTPKSLFTITNATSYDLDDVTIRLGELRNPSSPSTIRGILCFASLRGAPERKGRAVLTSVVDELGFAEAKKSFGACNDRKEEVKLWCDALKQRS